jgi:hypothetical protein
MHLSKLLINILLMYVIRLKLFLLRALGRAYGIDLPVSTSNFCPACGSPAADHCLSGECMWWKCLCGAFGNLERYYDPNQKGVVVVEDES